MLRGSLSLTGYTYLWMFPIYGMAVFFEPVHNRLRSAPWLVRGTVWVSLIFLIEYLSGWLIKSVIGFCPWDYSGWSKYAVDGLIRLDFLPFWFGAGLGFEIIHDFMDSAFARYESPVLFKPPANYSPKLNRQKRPLLEMVLRVSKKHQTG